MSEPQGGHDEPAIRDDATDAEHGAAHDEEALGPLDVEAWAAGLLGILVGLVTALGFVIATNRLPV